VAVRWYSNYNDTLNFSDVTPRITLQAGASVSVTVPGVATNNLQVKFDYSPDAIVYVGYNEDVTVPAPGVVTTGRFSELLPEQRFVKGGDVLYFVTPDPIAYIGIAYKSLD
jgi:hypothetical protein